MKAVTDGDLEDEKAEAAEAREQEIVAATKRAIEKNRKADAKVRVVDAAGRPVPGVKITIEQTGHDFLFGFDQYRTEAQNAQYKRRTTAGQGKAGKE